MLLVEQAACPESTEVPEAQGACYHATARATTDGAAPVGQASLPCSARADIPLASDMTAKLNRLMTGLDVMQGVQLCGRWP